MTELDREQQLALVREAGRAPSVHNVQPARWRFLPGGEVVLFEDVSRRLAVGDPSGRDAAASLGAAFEGLGLALSRRGLALEIVERDGGGVSGDERDRGDRRSAPPSPLRPVARARIVACGGEDPLAACVPLRGSWRGRFVTDDAEARKSLIACLDSRDDAHSLVEPGAIEEIAAINDRCLWSFMRDPRYRAEFYSWVRFSPADPCWHRDGLTTACMALSPLESRLASVLLRPAALGALGALGLGSALVSEAKVTRSAAGIVLFTRPEGEHPLDTGRAFYRLWLELAANGLHACPMSAIADAAEGAGHVRSRWGIATGTRLVNVLRVGRPRGKPAASPRLPAGELLV